MADSPITLTFTATPTFRGNKLVATVTRPGPSQPGGLPQFQPDVIEWVASTTNDRSGATLAASGYPDALHAGLIEETTYYYWARVKDARGLYGDYYPSGSTSGIACTAVGMAGLLFGLANGKLVATVSANALTIAVKTAAGNDPSASDPVYVPFRNATQSIGNYTTKQISAALSLTISNGSTLGVAANSTPFRIWVVIFNDAGTLKLGAYNASTSTGVIYPLAETALAAFVDVDNGSGNADTAGVFYTSSSLTDKTFRTLGYVEYPSGLASFGVWASAPSIVRLAGAGAALPGQTVQDFGYVTAVHGGTNTSVVPFDDTIPQSNEGRSILGGINLTPASACNFFDVEGQINIASSVASEIIASLFRDAGSDAIQSTWSYAPAADKPIGLRFHFRLQAGSTAQRTFDVRVGASQAGTITIGGTAGSGKLGGVLTDIVSIKELAG
jgi:hypothetical protein